MLEAPEAAHIARQLHETLRGKQISLVVTGFTPHKFMFPPFDAQRYEAVLTGKTVTGARAFAGMVQIEAGDARMVFSDGANLTYVEPGGKLPARHQFLVGFDDDSALVVTIRMYGGVMVFEGDDCDSGMSQYYDASRKKPQVLSDDFSWDYFSVLLEAEHAKNLSSKAFLATKQTVPGLGNGVLQDILYNAGIHPKTKIKELSAQRRRRMYDAVVGTLREMEERGGRRSETDIFGQAGGYSPILSKDTVGGECVRCGGIIMKENYLGGAIYYCPGCQK